MRTRYFRDNQGNPSIRASVYEQSDHGISKGSIDTEARKICTRLKVNGHQGYIVGGAVRDLLLGKQPKDFDIATDAPPNRVKRLFRNSRVIGRRFRLVHIFFGGRGDNIYEVATFRSADSVDEEQIFGTIQEDVKRRDFSLNALYFDVDEETIIDFVNGVEDIRKKVIKSVLPLHESFVEDPVRMLRCVKYSAMTQMKIARPVSRQIKKQSTLLSDCSISRLSEELNKILKSRNAQAIFQMMDSYNLIHPMLPQIASTLKSNNHELKDKFFSGLQHIDNLTETRNSSWGLIIRYLTEDILDSNNAFQMINPETPIFDQVVKQIKELFLPLVQPNRYIDEATRMMLTDRGIKVQSTRYDRLRRRRRRLSRKS